MLSLVSSYHSLEASWAVVQCLVKEAVAINTKDGLAVGALESQLCFFFAFFARRKCWCCTIAAATPDHSHACETSVFVVY
mmetsp:Transcript_26535/g.74253  ORF Transcript_26535/g.74253 Transcript_26535/m.74253 type:complete len:80 (-) Transcript_26535:355-594(-)